MGGGLNVWRRYGLAAGLAVFVHALIVLALILSLREAAPVALVRPIEIALMPWRQDRPASKPVRNTAKASARRDAASGPVLKGVDLGAGSVGSTDGAVRPTLRGVLGCRSHAAYLTKEQRDNCLEVQGREARNGPTFALRGAKQDEWAADIARQNAPPKPAFVACPYYTQLSNFDARCLQRGP